MNSSPLFHSDIVNSNRVLYTPSDFARSSLLHLQEIGMLQARKQHINSRRDLASYLFFIVCSGSGTLTYDEITYPLSQGDCVFLDCQKPNSHETSQNLWQLKWIHFYGPSMSQIYNKYVDRGGLCHFHPTDLTSYEQIWKNLFQIANSQDYIRDMRINEILSSLLTLLMTENGYSTSHPGEHKKNQLLDIKEYLDLHYGEKITLDDLSTRFYINKYYLTRIFKEQFGIPINQYLQQIRITHAKQLLRFSDKTAEAIANECGFESVHYFSRTFKKIEGLCPSEYRKKW